MLRLNRRWWMVMVQTFMVRNHANAMVDGGWWMVDGHHMDHSHAITMHKRATIAMRP
jgi:hypothetical protein